MLFLEYFLFIVRIQCYMKHKLCGQNVNLLMSTYVVAVVTVLL